MGESSNVSCSHHRGAGSLPILFWAGRMSAKPTALPDYDRQLSGFHKAFEAELEAALDALPLKTAKRVLDLACGDGFYTRRLAERMGPEASITGADLNQVYLDKAKQEARLQTKGAKIDFVIARFDELPFAEDSFDLVWCAQGLFSLPDPVLALEHMRRVVRPGGLVAILENDSLHQVSLPWPVPLELEVRAAELQAFIEEGRHSSRYYIGRRLPSVIAAAGLEPLKMTTQAIDRQAPLGKSEQILLQSYLENVAKRVAPHLEASLFEKLADLIDPKSNNHLLRQPYLHMTWLNVLAIGKKPL